VFPVPDPLDGPGGEGGKGGAGTRLILELTTDWAVEILLGGAVGPRIGVCDVRAVLYDLNISYSTTGEQISLLLSTSSGRDLGQSTNSSRVCRVSSCQIHGILLGGTKRCSTRLSGSVVRPSLDWDNTPIG
jgi:hypothetical protein